MPDKKKAAAAGASQGGGAGSVGTSRKRGRPQRLEPTCRAKTISDQSCPKPSTGNRSRHSRLRRASPSLSENLLSPDPIRSRSKFPMV